MTGWLGPEEWQAVALSLKVAAWATALSLPPGILVAYALARWRFRGKQVLNALVLLLGFGRNGPIGGWLEAQFGLVLAFRWTGAVLAAAIMAFPLMVRAIRQGIEAVDPRLEEAAATLGAPRLAVFATVTLPLILPGLITGAVLAFAKAMGEFGATITFVSSIPGQTQTLSTAMFTLLQVPGGEGPALRLAAISVVIAVGALLVSELLARRAARRVAGA